MLTGRFVHDAPLHLLLPSTSPQPFLAAINPSGLCARGASVVELIH